MEKKKNAKIIVLLIFATLLIVAICNIYSWIVSGNQYIKINTSSKAYTNSNLYVSVIAQEHGVDLETKTKLKLLDYNGNMVKNVKTEYDGSNAILVIPEIESGNYYLEANVSSKVGQDIVKKEIYISDGNRENITINLDKGIYKPGDTVNYRALITKKENDHPVSENINVCIYDGNGNKVYNENVESSDYGIISGSFSLADEVNSGLYKIVVKSNANETTKQFKVNPYVTPKYEVNIEYDKESYLVGETANIMFNTKYFFGEAVKDADITVYIDNNEYTKLKTDSQGIAKIAYKIAKAKTHIIKVEVVDTSNYYVEETSTFIAGTDIFEIELLPEYGKLIEGRKNDVYVFTSKADGTPLKTYVTISSDKFTKQIATDENGIGKFSIDINSNKQNTNNYYDYYKKQKQFSITAEDESKNVLKKNLSLDIEQKNLLLSTDKVKYEQGEDIKLKIDSLDDNSKNIYFFKDDKLVKMVSSDFGDTTVNLEDTYGLIDIYVTEKQAITDSMYGYYSNYNNSNIYQKTIFIKPEKQLSININTDKQEYIPGEQIGISFETADENKNKTDSALLVSMLDNSILSLANNDLSIDNIKLALQDIKFSNDLDGATLYSCIINDKSEQTIMALLLKQQNRDISISQTGMYNTEQKDQSALTSLTLIIIIGVTVVTFLCIKFKNVRKILEHIANFIILEILLGIVTLVIMANLTYTPDLTWFVTGAIIDLGLGLLVYIQFLSKISNKITRTSISIIIACLMVIQLAIIGIQFKIHPIVCGIIMIFVCLNLVLLDKVVHKKKLKCEKYTKIIVKEIDYIFKFIGGILTIVPCAIILNAILDATDFIEEPAIVIVCAIIAIYFINYVYNKIGKDEKIGNNEKNSISTFSIIIIGIIVFAIGYTYIWAFRNISTSPLETEINGISIDSFETNNRRNSDNDIRIPRETSFTTGSTSANNGDSSIFSGIEDLFKSETSTNSSQEESLASEEKIEMVKDNNVRNIFLESMCFIPDIITTNGTAKVDLKLSDNITTWTIQTIGNTKDGRIGYGIKDNVKVFKEFFVDFELPKNLVETDKVSIPVTVYNYTGNTINTNLKIIQDNWFTIENSDMNINVEANSTSMVYVPITILKAGNNKFRAEVSGNLHTDIVEKECKVSTNGYKVEKVVSAGRLNENISEDVLILEDIIPNTAKAKVKIYPSVMAQTIEGMENIFKMPTGCFEQISSSLYPNILALKYMEDNGIVNEDIKEKALSYISKGYQKLLTYEVIGESGGYSLYGKSPAETVLTAYGLIEISDLSKVYGVAESITKKMTEFLYKKQNLNGSFTITGNHLGGNNSFEELSLNAYITWALSESNPNDDRLQKSVEYLKGKIDKIDDNYTLALIGNILANVKDGETNNVLKRLVSNINLDENSAYITSKIVDYYGARSNMQTIQTVALTSMALSKTAYNPETNRALINYIISKKDPYGTWNSTQATILSLKAVNIQNEKGKLQNQTINVKINSNEQKIEIKDNPLEYYELTFDNLAKENKLNIELEKGNAYYEVVEEYYIPYEKLDTKNDNIEVLVESNNELSVNDILKANVKVVNRSGNDITNGIVTISIPQGFSVIEESLMQLESKGKIEKYEMSYTSVNIYLRNTEAGQIVNLDVWFRANYPVQITGMSTRVYDYYNPEIEGKTKPVEIVVK